MTKNVKIAIGLIYILCLGLTLYGFFIFTDINQLNDYSYIRDKTQFLISIKDHNPLWFTILFFFIYYNLDFTFRFRDTYFFNFGFYLWKIYGTVISSFQDLP